MANLLLDNQILEAYAHSLQRNITYSQYLSDLSDGWHNLQRRNGPEIQSESPINRSYFALGPDYAELGSQCACIPTYCSYPRRHE
jgi:hypothetical protein